MLPSTEMGVTVVVPTLNRGGVLLDCLRDLLAQRHRPLEILIVDQSESVPDELTALVAAHADVISYHRVNFQGLPLARNYAWQLARHETVLYIDDDIRCGPELVSRHVDAFLTRQAAVVGGGVDEVNKPPDLCAAVGRFDRWTCIPTRGFGAHEDCPVEHVPGGNFSTTRTVLRALGGFDEILGQATAVGEELEFCLRAKRAGYQIWFCAAARLQHLAAPRGGCRIADPYEYAAGLGYNRGVLIRRHSGLLRGGVALARLAVTGVSLAWRSRSPALLLAVGCGCGRGLLAGGQTPRCTRYPRSAGPADDPQERAHP